jgi:hypothetical protein
VLRVRTDWYDGKVHSRVNEQGHFEHMSHAHGEEVVLS